MELLVLVPTTPYNVLTRIAFPIAISDSALLEFLMSKETSKHISMFFFQNVCWYVPLEYQCEAAELLLSAFLLDINLALL